MFCPKCGQEQLEALNYCSKCGFQLTEVSSLIARDGAAADPRVDRVLSGGMRRSALRFLWLSLAFLALTVYSEANDGDASVAIFGLLTSITSVVGFSLLISSWVRSRRARRVETAPVGQPTTRVDASEPGALPAYV